MNEIHNHSKKWNIDISLICQQKYCINSANFNDENDEMWCEKHLQEKATEYYSDELFGDDSFEQALEMYIEQFGVEEI